MHSERYNGRMRLLASFAFVALLCAPFVIGAETQEEKFTKMCVGHTGNPTGSQAFKSTDADIAAKIRTYITERALCPSACYDIAVVIKVEGLDLTLNISAANKCKDPQPTQSDIKNVYTPLKSPNESRSCKGEKGPATITVEAPTKIEPPKSRCSEQATSGDIGAVGVGSATKEEVAAYALQTQLAYEIGNVNPSTPEGQSQLSQVLQKFGMPEADANARVDSAEKAQSVQEQLQQLARATTPEQAKSIGAKLGLPLSGDLTQQSWLNPDKFASVITDQQRLQELRSQANDLYGRSESTFPPNQGTQQQGNPYGLPVQCGVQGLAGNFMRAESSCNRKNISTTGCAGPYHYCAATWRRDACDTGHCQYSDPRYSYDVNIATKVLDAKNAQYEERYGASWDAIGMPRATGLYACHVMGEGGCKAFTNLYAQNPNASAELLRPYLGTCGAQWCYDINASVYRGKSIAGVGQELQNRLGGGGSVISTYASGGSPLGGITSQYGYQGSYTYGGSPLAQANPFGVYGQGYYGLSVPTGSSLNQGGQLYPYGSGVTYSPYGQMNSPLGSIGGIFSLLFSNLFNQGSGTSQNYGQSGFGTQPNTSTPSMSISAQPPQTTKGESITVTWSATGMSAGQPCVVYAFDGASTSTLANALSGAQSVTAQNAGTYRFTLQCIDVSGSLQSTTASVSVQ